MDQEFILSCLKEIKAAHAELNKMRLALPNVTGQIALLEEKLKVQSGEQQKQEPEQTEAVEGQGYTDGDNGGFKGFESDGTGFDFGANEEGEKQPTVEDSKEAVDDEEEEEGIDEDDYSEFVIDDEPQQQAPRQQKYKTAMDYIRAQTENLADAAPQSQEMARRVVLKTIGEKGALGPDIYAAIAASNNWQEAACRNLVRRMLSDEVIISDNSRPKLYSINPSKL